MRSINKKALRELLAMRGQALAIAMVIGSGVATFVLAASTMDSLERTRADFYRDYRFADVFVSLKRAPESVRRRIDVIPGVDKVDTRVVAQVNLDIDGFADPVTGLLTSVPERGEPITNRIYLRAGKLPEANRDDQVVVSEAFAQAHDFKPGDSLRAVINARRQRLTIVGIGLSPEFVYQIRPGDLFPDHKRYGILWMGRKALATAYDMDGAFNNVALLLERGAEHRDIIDRLDELLNPYGGQGAYARADQYSHRYLAQQFQELATMATVFPLIFLGVAAFLLNVVTTRLIATERDQIGTLKAFGYSNLHIGLHYTAMVSVIVLLGAVVGIGAGVWLGRGLSTLYGEFFRFPYLHFVLRPWVALTAVLIAGAASLAGTIRSVQRAAALPPAEAMRPEPPMRYRRTIVERLGAGHLLDQPSRMIARHINRHPVKSLLTLVGIAFSVAIMMVGSFQEDAIDYMMDVHFNLTAREDLTVSFVEPSGSGALYELNSLPGVEHAEGFRAVPVRLRFEHRSYRTAIHGFGEDADLHRLLNERLQPIALPAAGIVLTDYLGKRLGARAGDVLTVEVLEGRRPTIEVPLVGLVAEFIGANAYMDLTALNRVMDEGHAISGAFLATDVSRRTDIYRELKETPRVAGVGIREEAIESFSDTMGDTILIFAFVNTMLAGSIAFGVVFNSARIAFSERSRELASLRVLGFSRGEISYILLGELAVLTLLAIPFGFLAGWELSRFIASNLESELYRVPLVVESTTYAFAATVVLTAALISGAIMKKKLDRLDLVSVLKTRE